MSVETTTTAASAGPTGPVPPRRPRSPAPQPGQAPPVAAATRSARCRASPQSGVDAPAPGRATVTSSAVDLVCSGLLEGGRGVAGAASAAFLPGRRSDQPARTAVEIRTVSGQDATDRVGAAERLGLSLNTVRMFSSPAQRTSRGFPAPLPERVDGRDWFALADLDAYRAARSGAATAPPAGDADQLLDLAEFAALRGVEPGTMHHYVQLSMNDWAEHRDGYLPYPDEIEPARNGNVYRWKRARAVAWVAPDRRRTGGRTPGPAPTVADLEAVLAEAGDKPLKNREIAAALSARLGGRPVSTQVVQRLNRTRRNQHAGDGA